jgi:hypothetical protein
MKNRQDESLELAKQFFEFQLNIEEEDKLPLGCLSLRGETQIWYQLLRE